MSLKRGILGVCAVVLVAACKGEVDTTAGANGGNGGSGANGGAGATGGSGGDGGAGASSGGGSSTSTGTAGMVNTTINTGTGGQGGAGDCAGLPDEDVDGDGFSPIEGDCNDCNPDVNPGAVELIVTDVGPNGNLPEPVDEDCDGAIDNVAPPCDSGIAIDDADPVNGARALELCQTESPAGVKWGVLGARYVRADGVTALASNQRGIKTSFGPNVNPQGGASLLVLSSGAARAADDFGACGLTSCNGVGAGTAPPGFPQEVPGCDGDASIYDDFGLQLQIRTPVNADGYSFDVKLLSFEFPEWVCTPYNDQLIALITPPPPGSVAGNVLFDGSMNPAGVNMSFFDVCDPFTLDDWAIQCSLGCPPAPSPYCPLGASELVGTGFGEWGTAGATSWLRTTAPVVGGSIITVRFALWDAGDQSLDSTALLDNWQWISNKTVPVATERIADPK